MHCRKASDAGLPDRFRLGRQLQQFPDRTKAEAIGPALGPDRRKGGADDPITGEVRALRPGQPKASRVLADYETGANPASTAHHGTGSVLRSANRTTARMPAIADSLTR